MFSLTQCSRLFNSFNQNQNCCRSRLQKLHCLNSNSHQSWKFVSPTILPTTKSDLKKLQSNDQQSVRLARRKISSITNGTANKDANLDMRVFRLLRCDEDPAKGLFPESSGDVDDPCYQTQNDEFNLPLPFPLRIATHIKEGSRIPSLFISASKSLDVCLFFASKSMHERKIDCKHLRIAEIMLDLSKGDIWDLSCERSRMKLAIEKRTIEDNYAKRFEEVIIDRCIDAEEVVDIFQAVPEQGLPRAKSFESFIKQLKASAFESESY